MTPQQREAAEAMYSTLKHMPCICQHNVLYADMKIPQFVTKKCGPCRVTELWELANQSTPKESI